MVDFGAKMAKPNSSVHSAIFYEWAVRASVILSTLKLEQENSEVICIGVCEKVVGLGESGGKEVDKGVGDIQAPWWTSTVA